MSWLSLHSKIGQLTTATLFTSQPPRVQLRPFFIPLFLIISRSRPGDGHQSSYAWEVRQQHHSATARSQRWSGWTTTEARRCVQTGGSSGTGDSWQEAFLHHSVGTHECGCEQKLNSTYIVIAAKGTPRLWHVRVPTCAYHNLWFPW